MARVALRNGRIMTYQTTQLPQTRALQAFQPTQPQRQIISYETYKNRGCRSDTRTQFNIRKDKWNDILAAN